MSQLQPAPGSLAVERISKSFGDHVAVDRVGFSIEPGELAALLGPSGCGKTTLLRSIAGLETPDAGLISLGERVLYRDIPSVRIPPNRRAIGMVFQSYALWPHMTVFQNVAYPLAVQRASMTHRRYLVSKMLSQMHLGEFEKRYPYQLSGGEQQRVALARAIVTRPELLLLDEPLSNLDTHLRKELRGEIKRLKQEAHVTVLHVTHDQTEAMALADRLVVMSNARIEQVGPAAEVYKAPATAFVARFVGDANLLEATTTRGSGRTILRLSDGEILEMDAPMPPRMESGQIAVNPQEILLSKCDGAQALITEREFLGDMWLYTVQVGETRLRVHAPFVETYEINERVGVRLLRGSYVRASAPNREQHRLRGPEHELRYGHHRGRKRHRWRLPGRPGL